MVLVTSAFVLSRACITMYRNSSPAMVDRSTYNPQSASGTLYIYSAKETVESNKAKKYLG